LAKLRGNAKPRKLEICGNRIAVGEAVTIVQNGNKRPWQERADPMEIKARRSDKSV